MNAHAVALCSACCAELIRVHDPWQTRRVPTKCVRCGNEHFEIVLRWDQPDNEVR